MQITIAQALAEAKIKLAEVAENPALEADILLAAVLDVPRSHLHAWPEKTVSAEIIKLFATCIERRCQGEPVAYIVGQKEFWALTLSVTQATLIPRPETELLVETVLALFPQRESVAQLADLGTGSGAIALALAHERPKWTIYATDISDNALAIASKNAQGLGFTKVSFCHGSWCSALPCTDFDVIVSNPPYIAETEWAQYASGLAFEPRSALVSGLDGLDAIRAIVCEAPRYLKRSGFLCVEHGFLQGEKVREIFLASGFTGVRSVCDLAGLERVTVGQVSA